MKIILIRHAEVEIDKNMFTYASELKKWLEIYDHAEIKKALVAKDEILTLFNQSDTLFCSRLKRSLDSVALYGKSPDETDELFNEAGLPFANWGWVKLPLSLWVAVFRVMWLFGYANNGESLQDTKIRAKKGAERLIEACAENRTVTLLGHGLMNRLTGKELVKRGWQPQGKMGSANWGYGVFKV